MGGESSGGLAIPQHVMAKDSLLSIVLVLQMLSTINKPIDEIIKEVRDFAEFHMICFEKQYSYDPDKKQQIMNLLFEQKALPEKPTSLKTKSLKAKSQTNLKKKQANTAFQSLTKS